MAASDELNGFVKNALARGLSRQQVEEALKQAGWNDQQVSGAMGAFAAIDFPIPVPKPRPSLSAREAFIYLLLFTTLYIVAFNLGSLIFQFIDRALPDATSFDSEPYMRASIRWSVASLIVALPVFLFMSRLTGRASRADAKGRTSPVQRWLTYLTLFVAACVLIGDFVSLFYNLLGGELTARFVLKVLTVGVIAGSVFWYYLTDLRQEEREARG